MRALRTLLVPVLFVAAASAPTPARRQPTIRFDLEEVTVAALQQRMETGQESARSIAEKYLARIEAIDRSGPALHSVIEVNPDALAIADRLDVERKAGRIRGSLHGIPVLIKDNIATADHLMTTAGSLALEGARPPEDAFLVRQLRAAGAELAAGSGFRFLDLGRRDFSRDLELCRIERQTVRCILDVFPDQEGLRAGVDSARGDVQEARLDFLAKLNHIVPHLLATRARRVRLIGVRRRQLPPQGLQFDQRSNLLLRGLKY